MKGEWGLPFLFWLKLTGETLDSYLIRLYIRIELNIKPHITMDAFIPTHSLLLVTRTSFFTGKTRTREFKVTPEQFAMYQSGRELIQNIFPEFSRGDLEFIKSGITEEEWAKEFGDMM